MRSAAAGRAPCRGISRAAPMIIPAPAVKLVAESIRMKLPVSRLLRVGIEEQRAGRRDDGLADLVQREPAVHFRGDRSGVVLEQIHPARIERPFVHPHDVRLDAVGDLNRAAGQHVAAADVDFVRSSTSVTDIGANASSRSPSKVTIRLTDAVTPEGKIVSGSPSATRPDTICPHSLGTS